MRNVNDFMLRYLKAIILPALLISGLVANAADCDSINDQLTSKFRYLGDWDAKGSPLYLELEDDIVSDALVEYVNATLPESVKVPGNHDEYLGDVQLNTELKEKSKVYITMVGEGASWANTFGFYTYDIANPPQTVYDIDSLVVLFPNVSEPNVVQTGNKVLLGEFSEGTGIGYFLMARGWVGDTICLSSHILFTDKHLNTFTSEQFQQQTILLNYEPEEKLLLCFEDVMRPAGDNDFNDAVFYVTAEPGAIDTTNIPKIPTALLSGDTTLCDENSPAELELVLTGKAPWSVTITNGIEDQTFDNIIDSTMIIETVLKDSIWIKSFSDSRKTGIKSGYALANLSNPKATLSESMVMCSDIEAKSGYIVQLDGVAPYSFTYSIDGIESTVENLVEDKYELAGEVGAAIQLISMTDNYCTGEVSNDIFIIKNVTAPTLVLDGSGPICGDSESTTLDLSLEGEGPWTVNYLYGEEEVSLVVETSEYALSFETPGRVEFQSITDANCTRTVTNIYEIEQKNLPTATIEEYQSDCGDPSATVTVALTGEGPWTIEYLLNGETNFANSDEATLLLDVQTVGLLELAGIQDAFCENTAEGSQQIEIFETPTAVISGDASICDNEEATVQVALTGIAPYTFVYTDGETETTVTTDDSLYEFTTSEYKSYTLVSITDAYCNGTGEGSATISDGSEDLNVEIDSEENSCFGEEITLALIGDTDNLTISWTTEGGGSFSNTDQQNTVYTPAENETGDIVFFAEVTNGCAIKTVSKTITIIEELSAEFDISPNKELLTNTQITFTPDVHGYDEYSWDFGDETGSSASIASTEYARGDTYKVTLNVNLAGCEANGEEELQVLSNDALYIPNVFHPYAQNAENQVVKVYGNNIDENEFYFKIVNRWGKVMFETRSFDEANSIGWHGVNNNNGEEQELNVFTYIVRGKFVEGPSFERTGTVTQLK